ncbi:hypothetical protein GALMADRAFT_147322 [Galerina marginata CBS 339.88]|uniref:F-box domain-containing protein n=1 Tax=Galerina marginata (strain CBS 339.88) TaxID=685588 RepID=A0A067S8F1_GALM3|nr:hypothetical protein GALMADRAFT_147322 [Galerina marginata CBS 339.88]
MPDSIVDYPTEDATAGTANSGTPGRAAYFDQDCLLLIFDIIASKDASYLKREQTPWCFITRCSQVCKSWRGLILDSPRLWGKIVHLDILFEKQKGPGEEYMMQRTGDALLWVHGHDYTVYGDELALFLGKYWERIEILDIAINFDKSKEINENIMPILCRPALRIKVFLILANMAFQRTDSSSLFKDIAPNLQKYMAPFSVSNKLANITDLSLTNVRSIFEALQPLTGMDKLVTLYIGLPSKIDSPTTFFHPKISLQELRSLALRGDYEDCTHIMSLLEVGPRCCVSLMADSQTASPAPSHFSPEVLVGYFDKYAGGNTIGSICVCKDAGSTHRLGFWATTRVTKLSSLEGHVIFKMYLDDLLEGTFNEFLSRIAGSSSTSLGRIETFFGLLDKEVVDAQDLRFLAAKLSGLRTLEANPRFLELVFDSPGVPTLSAFFPNLQIINLYPINNEENPLLFLKKIFLRQENVTRQFPLINITMVIKTIVPSGIYHSWRQPLFFREIVVEIRLLYFSIYFFNIQR